MGVTIASTIWGHAFLVCGWILLPEHYLPYLEIHFSTTILVNAYIIYLLLKSWFFETKKSNTDFCTRLLFGTLGYPFPDTSRPYVDRFKENEDTMKLDICLQCTWYLFFMFVDLLCSFTRLYNQDWEDREKGTWYLWYSPLHSRPFNIFLLTKGEFYWLKGPLIYILEW